LNASVVSVVSAFIYAIDNN